MGAHVKEALPPAAKRPHAHEFLLVCDDAAVVTRVAAAVDRIGGQLSCTDKPSSACDSITQRQPDAIVIHMDLPGSLDLLRRLRRSCSIRRSVIFAWVGEAAESQDAIRAGANFILQQPLEMEKIAHIFRAAEEMMLPERRRYFRSPLMVPVELQMKQRRVESTMSNLSKGGMAIWSLYYHIPGSPVRFAFEIPFGGVIRGEGEVAWTDADGLAGIRFHALPDQAHAHLAEWISGGMNKA